MIAAIIWKPDFSGESGEKESYALYYTLVVQCSEMECILISHILKVIVLVYGATFCATA